MARQIIALVLLVLLLVSENTIAASRPDLLQRPEVQEWIADFAKRDNLPRQFIVNQLKKAKVQEVSIRSVDAPYKAPPPWHEYAPRFFTSARINNALAFWKTNAAAIDRAAKTYGVPPEIIVAIISIETNCGRNTGRHRLIDSLVTLAFEYPRRSQYFRTELEALLLMAYQNNLDLGKVYGSYAGAMGLAQFMPRSYRRFAVDFDNNGRIDLWEPTDAIGSIAVYLKEHGWRSNAPIVDEITLASPDAIDWGSNELTSIKNGNEWKQLGVTSNVAPFTDNEPLSLFRLEFAPGMQRHYAAYDNFRVILKYNRSKHYASAVNQLATILRARMQ